MSGNILSSGPGTKPSPIPAADWPKPGYAWYVVLILTLAYTLSYIDRQILALVLEPIRQDMAISDTQVSLLAGMAFAMFYVVMGIPLGRLADRINRRNLIMFGIFLWSLMTALCGLAQNFWQLFIARIGVGVGEATLSPAAYSMIADYFPPDQRIRPLSSYNIAIPIGSSLAFIVGGTISYILGQIPTVDWPLVGVLRPWQVTFFAVGLPGLIFVLIMLTVREPVRRERGPAVVNTTKGVPFRQVLHFVFHENRKTFLVIFLAYGGLVLYSVALTIWLPTLFVRKFGWTISQIGLAQGSILLVFATLGIILSMNLATRLKQRGQKDGLMRTSLIMGVLATPPSIALPLLDDPIWILALYCPIALLCYGLYAVVPAVLQFITPNQMRGQVSALFSFFNNVIGLMLGITYVALITDFVFQDGSKLNYSLCIVAITTMPPSLYGLWWGLRHYRDSTIRAEAWMIPSENAAK